jgi:AraC-like DNA-binding protein
MSKPTALRISCCVFLHKQTDESRINRIYDKLRVKHDAHDLTDESMITALAECSHRYGLFITTDTNHLFKLLLPFHKELKNAKLWVVGLHQQSEINLPDYTQNVRYIDVSDLSPTVAYKLIKPAIAMAKGEMTDHLKAEISQQKPTTDQERLSFLKELESILEKHHSNSKLRVSFMAAAMGISVSTLERRSEKLTGKLPGQLLTQFRLEKANYLVLNSSLPMAAIAQKTGFTSNSYFSVRYSDYFGSSPSQKRNQQHQKAS